MSDDPNEKKDEIERMSFADLLDMSGAEGDGRVQERDDEPGSGIARLAQMVATSSVMEAKRPSLMPTTGSMPPTAPTQGSIPPAQGSMPPAQGSMPPVQGAMPQTASVPPMGSIPPSGSMPPVQGGMYGEAAPGASMPPQTASMPPQAASMPPQAAQTMQQPYGGAGMGGMAGSLDDYGLDQPKKSSKTGLIIGIVVGVIALGAAAFFLLGGEDDTPAAEDDPQLAKLQAQLDDMKAKAAAPAPEPAAASESAAAPEPAAGGASPAADENNEEVAAASADENADEAQEEEEAEEEEEAPAKPMTRAEKRRAARAAKVAKKAAAKAAKSKAAKSTPSSNTKKSGSSLGSLLDNDVASGKKSAGSTPKTPSRADVKSAMRPVQSKAAKCAKYSKGTVKLKIVVGSNGRVKSSTPVGGSANQTAANCVAMIARTARFPKFTDPTFSINYPITLK